MGEAKQFVLDNLGGGVNYGADPTDLKDNEFTELKNWYPYAGRLIRRGGTVRISGSLYPFVENLTNAFAYKTAVGQWTLIVGGLTRLGKLDGGALVEIPQRSGAFTSSDEHWSFAQYKDIVYAARYGASALQRTDGSVVEDAGIVAPATAPTLTQSAGAGNLVAGKYIGVVTFYNSVTGAESDPSDNSTTLDLAADKKIEWSDIPVSGTPQVNARRLYRTLVDQEGEYYFVGQINDNSTTTYTDNAIQSEMGTQVSFENGVPPAGLRVIEVYNERLWATDGKNLYFSAIALPESYYALDYLQVNPDDGHKIKGLLNFGDRLFVGKTNAMYYITGTDAATFQLQTLSDRHGCHAHHSFKASEGFGFWFGGDNFYQTDGNVVRAIGDIKIRDVVEGISSQYYHKIISAVDSSKSWYISLVPYNSSTLNTAIVFNYKDESWTIFDWRMPNNNLGAPQFITDFYDTYGKRVVYSNMGGGGEDSIFQLFEDTSNLDIDKAIECSLVTKYFGTDSPETLKYMRRVGIQASVLPEYLVATLLGDAGQTKSGPSSVYMYPGRNWKRFPLANNGSLAAAMALKLQYNGTQPMEVLGIAFDVVDTGRKVSVSEIS